MRGALPALRYDTIEARSRGYVPQRQFAGPQFVSPHSPQGRQILLDTEIARSVAAGGVLQSNTGGVAVISYGWHPNHVLHLLLSVVTWGLWLPVWLALALISKPSRVMLTFDEYGGVIRHPIAH